MVENITPQLGEFFGVKSGKGVLVRAVDKGSRAEKAGFRAGDVIVKVNEQAVQDTSDFTHALRSRSGGNISVIVIRDKREQNLQLPLPDRKDSGAVIEESFDSPELDADTFINLSEVKAEIAQMQPQIQLATQMAQEEVEKARPEIENAMRQAQQEMRKHHADIERAANETRKAAAEVQREWSSQQKQMEQELRKAQREMQREMQKYRKDMFEHNRKQMERWQHEFSGDWLEI
jgi:membrane-associated protease RseP (regulator of RpoE activity)